MASAFGHALAAYAIGKTFNKKLVSTKLLTLGVISSILPDADVLSFSLEIPYESFWGHRGFSHSFVFAIIWAVFLQQIFYRRADLKTKGIILLYLFLATASHTILDAMTSGGEGVALFAPFDNSRYFLPWRPIKVSPIGASKFFSDRGLQVVFSELLWIGLPSILLILISGFIRRKAKK